MSLEKYPIAISYIEAIGDYMGICPHCKNLIFQKSSKTKCEDCGHELEW